MKHAMYGTNTVVYPAAAAYFDCTGSCEFKDERCGGPIRVRGYYYIERDTLPPGPDGKPIAQPFPEAAELLLDDGLDYIELCAIHHGEWWEAQHREWEARAAKLNNG
jgi:hypothetical protein